MTFKVGDRVKFIGEDNPRGKIGTVVYVYVDRNVLPYVVKFDDFNDGHDGIGCGNATNLGNSGWFCEQQDLDLVKEKIKLPEMVIHTKTQEEWGRVMKWLEDNTDLKFGYKKPTEDAYNWNSYKEESCILIEDCITFCSYGYFKDNNYNHILTTQEFFQKYDKGREEVKLYDDGYGYWYFPLSIGKTSKFKPSDFAQEYQNLPPDAYSWNTGDVVSFSCHKDYIGIDLSYKESLTKKTMRKLSELSASVRRLFNADEKALWKAGYIDECRNYTNKAREEVVALLCKEKRAELIEFAKEELETAKDEKDSCDC